MNTRYPLVWIAILCTMLLSTSLHAQDGFSAGAKVVGNANKFDATSVGFGYGAGAYGTLPIIGPLSARGEIMYVSYSGTLDDKTVAISGGSAFYENRNLRFHSIEIPILAQINLPVFKMLNPKFCAGWAYSYNFGVFEISDNTYQFQDSNGTTRSSKYNKVAENVGSSFEPYNSSIVGSLSANFERIHVDVRYQQGLPNLSIMNNVESGSYSGDYKTRTLSISVGYRIL